MNKLKIEIKNRWTGDVLFEYEKENNTVKDTLIEAVKERANLEGADLEGANLEGANLEGAYLYLSDEEIEQDKIIDNFEKNTGLKLTETYINHDIIPTRWNCFWRNGLIIRKYEVAPVVKEVKKMTVSEICKELGYEIEIIKEN